MKTALAAALAAVVFCAGCVRYKSSVVVYVESRVQEDIVPTVVRAEYRLEEASIPPRPPQPCPPSPFQQ